MSEHTHHTEPLAAARAREYPPSGIRAVFDRAARYDDVVKLTVGEPDFDTPERIVEAGVQALRDGRTRYTPNGGDPRLRHAIAERYSSEWGRAIDERNVMVTVGGAEALLLAFLAVLEPGDEILVPNPGYPSYAGQAHLLGARAVPLPLSAENGFRMTAEAVAPFIGPRTRALLINSPSNPLGTMLDETDLRGLIELSEQHGFTIISDEVYERIVYDEPHVSLAAIDPEFTNFIVVNSFSKSYAMTGWRLGYIIGPGRYLDYLPRMQEGIASCVPGFIQEAGIAAITGPDTDVTAMIEEYRRRRDLIVAGIGAIDGLECPTPRGAFYAFVDVRGTGLGSVEFTNRLLEQERVAVVPGTAFGSEGEGFVRLSYATDEATLTTALERIARFVGGI